MPDLLDQSVDSAQLEARLSALKQARTWSNGALDALRSLILTGDETELLRVSPLQFARRHLLPENEAIDLFLFAAHEGLFRLDWLLFCASCGCVVQSLKSLQTVHSHYRCEVCAGETDAMLDDYIAVYFSLSPTVRRLAGHDPLALSAEDYYFSYKYTRETWFAGGVIDDVPEAIRTVDYFRQRTCLLSLIGPRQSLNFEVEVKPDFFAIDESAFHSQTFFLVSPEPATSEQVYDLRLGDPVGPPIQIHSGKLRLNISNPTDQPVHLFAPNLPATLFQLREAGIRIDEPLLGKRLLTHSSFRELFRSEVVAADEGIGIRELTFLFTDLKGSTDLYERIGDLKAFALVREHFEQISRIIARRSGAVVKTIGDAVMAAFAEPADALCSAREILTSIEQFNHRLGSEDIILKIGLHKGPAIAVTLNDRIDYFGQTVNIAARVQALADADEIFLTDSLYTSPGIADMLSGVELRPESTKLKGIAEKVVVYKLERTCKIPVTG